jgi:hypothetical protein
MRSAGFVVAGHENLWNLDPDERSRCWSASVCSIGDSTLSQSAIACFRAIELVVTLKPHV